jgi:hypothetical protein
LSLTFPSPQGAFDAWKALIARLSTDRKNTSGRFTALSIPTVVVVGSLFTVQQKRGAEISARRGKCLVKTTAFPKHRVSLDLSRAWPVQKVSHRRREIARLTSRNRRNGEQDFRHGNQTGAIMTIAEYLAATALIALIVWAVLGLLMQES